jgi:glycerol-3-phosphate dehydrogenase
MQLSRRHVIETDAAARHVTIFGGKLTDCLNIGERLCAEATRLGVTLPWPRHAWYGEPPAADREAYQHQARLLGLDELAPKDGAEESPSARLWRRYGLEALSLLEDIRRDPRAAEPVLPSSSVLRCEVEAASRRELVVSLEDFLRRRTDIALTVRRDELRRAPGLREVSRVLFGDAGDEQRARYFPEDEARIAVPA